VQSARPSGGTLTGGGTTAKEPFGLSPKAIPRIVPDGFCPHCGTPTQADHPFCPKCGKAVTSVPAAAPAPAPVWSPGPVPSREHDRTVQTVVVVVVVVAVLLLAGLGYFYGIYVPEHNIVTMDGGTWLLNGADSSLGINVGCSNCGQQPHPGSDFTVDLNVQVDSCSSYYCGYYEVNTFSVNAPYVLVQAAPSNLPISENPGTFNTWALTVQAPASAGHDPLGGVVGVTYR
jgi:hypothetical protein